MWLEAWMNQFYSISDYTRRKSKNNCLSSILSKRAFNNICWLNNGCTDIVHTGIHTHKSTMYTHLPVGSTTSQQGLKEICHRPMCERSIKAALPGRHRSVSRFFTQLRSKPREIRRDLPQLLGPQWEGLCLSALCKQDAVRADVLP